MRTTTPLFFALMMLALVGSIGGCGGEASGTDAGPSSGMDAGGGPTPYDAGPPEACLTPGAIESVPCGRCGRIERFCTASRAWAYGACMGESGECSPGETDSAPCGNCGSQPARCTAACTWERTGTCAGEGECAPGTRTRTSAACAAGSTREVLCTDACVFMAASECANDGCPRPGALERTACGLCGMQDRFCNASGAWEYGTCDGEGACAPGTSRSAPCGRCGTRTERCVATCAWDTSGLCEGEAGDCVPGETRTSATGCPAGSGRLQRCSDACGFVDEGPCMPTGGGTRDGGGGMRDAGSGARDGGGCQPSSAACVVNTDCCTGFCFVNICL